MLPPSRFCSRTLEARLCTSTLLNMIRKKPVSSRRSDMMFWGIGTLLNRLNVSSILKQNRAGVKSKFNPLRLPVATLSLVTARIHSCIHSAVRSQGHRERPRRQWSASRSPFWKAAATNSDSTILDYSGYCLVLLSLKKHIRKQFSIVHVVWLFVQRCTIHKKA